MLSNLANRIVQGGAINKTLQSLEKLVVTEQYGVVYDLVAEGEIEGLVDGPNSIYLNDTPLFRNDEYVFRDSYGAFKNGTVTQSMPEYSENLPSASSIIAPGYELQWNLDYDTYASSRRDDPEDPPGSYPGQSAYIVTPLALGLNAYRTKATDKVVFGIEFPQGLFVTKSSGELTSTIAEFQIIFKYKLTGAPDWTSEVVVGRDAASYISTPWRQDENRSWGNAWQANYNSGSIIKGTRGAFTVLFSINLSAYEFDTWEFEIRRVTPHSSYLFTNSPSKYTYSGTSVLKTIEVQELDPINYAGSAYAITSFTARDFPTPPNRSYHVRGKKIKVPSNYTFDYETNHGTYSGLWSGSFITSYSNNPAWIFYDMLTNRKYGLGDFLTEADVDIYALYEIGQYCDQLVDDGKGGLEPRFTCNVYFTTQEEAYKVLKDLASAFRGMMYWIDGQITPVQDRPREPLYVFSGANVVDGIFNYQYTGTKARANQVNVTWNDPEERYRQVVTVVDDFDNIIETNSIVSKDVVAFGCTSAGQAKRVGVWHLLTDTLETEIVQFQTSINAGFLRPGDLVHVQDNTSWNQSGERVDFSGRLREGSTTTTIKLDRPVTLGAGSYRFHVIKVGGDTLPNGSISPTKVESANVVSFDDLTNTLIVSTGLTVAPEKETVWALGNINPYEEDAPTVKYRILGIAEEENHTYSIVASKYIPEKYDELEKNWASYGSTTPTVDVPAPTNLVVELVPMVGGVEDATSTTLQAVISWNEPVETVLDSAGSPIDVRYTKLNGYQLEHNFQSTAEFIRESTGVNSFTVPNVSVGTYTVRVRTVSTEGEYSSWIELTRYIEFGLPPVTGFNRVGRLVFGGTINAAPQFANGIITLPSNYTFISTSGAITTVANGTTAQTVIDASFLDDGFLPGDPVRSTFVAFDSSDSADPWKTIIQYYDPVLDVSYWKEYEAPGDGLVAVPGTVSGDVGDAFILGVGTDFFSRFKPGDLIKIGTTEYVEVAYVESDSVLFVASPLQGTFSGVTAYEQSWKPDFYNDNIVALISYDGDTYSIIYYMIHPGGIGEDGSNGQNGRVVTLLADRQAFVYDQFGDLDETVATSTTLTAVAFNATGIVEYRFFKDDVEVQAKGASATYAYTAPALYADMPDKIEVEMYEDDELVARDQLTIFGLKAGTDAITIVLSNDNHSIPANHLGDVDVGGYVGSGTNVNVWIGAMPVPHDNTSPYTIPSFRVSIGDVANIIEGTISYDPDGVTAVVGDHSGMAVDMVALPILVEVVTADGTEIEFVKYQSLNKSKAGAPGDEGTPGMPGISIFSSNEVYVFIEDTDGNIDTNEFSSFITIVDGGVVLKYSEDFTATVSASDNITGIITEDPIDTMKLTVTSWLNPSIPTASVDVTFTVDGIDYTKVFRFYRQKAALRGYSSLILDMSEAIATAFADDVAWDTAGFADDVIAEALSQPNLEGYLRSGDRITVRHLASGTVSTRIITSYKVISSVGALPSWFSSIVVQTIDGSLLVNGTIGADKVVTDGLITLSAQIGDGLVDTLRIKGNAVTVPTVASGTRFQGITGSIQESWTQGFSVGLQVVNRTAFLLDFPGVVYLQAIVSQGFADGIKPWGLGFRIFKDSVQITEDWPSAGGTGAANDAPSIATSFLGMPGIYEVELLWWSEDTTQVVHHSTLYTNTAKK